MVRRSRGDRGWAVAGLALTAILSLIHERHDTSPGWLGTAATGLSAVSLLMAVVGAVDVGRSGPRSKPLLKIGAGGVDVPGADPVPWSDIASIRITWGGWPSAIRAVAFIPLPGRPVPAVRASGLRTGPVGGRPDAVAARYGSALVVLPHLMTASATQTVDAARRHGDFDPPPPIQPGAERTNPPTGR